MYYRIMNLQVLKSIGDVILRLIFWVNISEYSSSVSPLTSAYLSRTSRSNPRPTGRGTPPSPTGDGGGYGWTAGRTLAAGEDLWSNEPYS